MKINEFIWAEKANFEVRFMCERFGVKKSTYYQWAKHHLDGPTKAEFDEAYLTNEIYDQHKASKQTYGSRRMTKKLRNRGYCVNHKRVARLMAGAGIFGVRPPRKFKTTIPDKSKGADLVNRNFVYDKADIAWCGDITYIRTTQGFLFLATVIDLGSRRVVGWSMSTCIDTDLIISALKMAVRTRGNKRMPGTIFHSDRGCQYTSKAFAQACELLGIRRSMGKTGICWDNAAAESFFATLKNEELYRLPLLSNAQARLIVFAYIEGWYNKERLHSTIGYMSPVEWETNQRNKVAKVA